MVDRGPHHSGHCDHRGHCVQDGNRWSSEVVHSEGEAQGEAPIAGGQDSNQRIGACSGTGPLLHHRDDGAPRRQRPGEDWIALELPPGSYGRIAPRSSLAIRGIETGAGVVDRDFRGEVKVLLRNHSDVDLRIYKGDRVAQNVVEKILELDVSCVEELSETSRRGIRGFGYSAHEELYPWAERGTRWLRRLAHRLLHDMDKRLGRNLINEKLNDVRNVLVGTIQTYVNGNPTTSKRRRSEGKTWV